MVVKLEWGGDRCARLELPEEMKNEERSHRSRKRNWLTRRHEESRSQRRRENQRSGEMMITEKPLKHGVGNRNVGREKTHKTQKDFTSRQRRKRRGEIIAVLKRSGSKNLTADRHIETQMLMIQAIRCDTNCTNYHEANGHWKTRDRMRSCEWKVV
jgi:hypothetical protein